jgi:mono/diheme cytochrome c family protein
VRAAMAYDGVTHRWRALFVRPLDAQGHSLQAALVPVAFALWDGGRGERGGYKQLSSWHYLRMPGLPLEPAALAAAAFGYHPGDLGDPEQGRALVETVCIACHQLPGKRYAPVGAAPDLSDIGAIATSAYLRDSVSQPSLVVVPNLQLNNHYSKAAPPDAWGAYPSAQAYAWGSHPDGGAAVSKMTVFSTFSPEQVANIVAFLKTLDGTRP